MDMDYYNTTQEFPVQCEMFSKKNKTQNQIVMSIARQLGTFTPSKIYRNYPIATTPITSIRRSINTLCYKENLIFPTGKKEIGLYGRNELQYKVKI